MALGSQQGNQVATPTWNGTNWSATATINDPDGKVLSLSCTSASFCAAADDFGYFMTWNGTSWSAPVPGATSAVYSLPCRSASFCMAVDDTRQALVFNGATWFVDTSLIFSGYGPVPAWVSCKSAKFCMATSAGTVHAFVAARDNDADLLIVLTPGVNGSSASASCSASSPAHKHVLRNILYSTTCEYFQ